jgi:uncharacterized cupredoxin-like copper-binding protein
MPTTPPRVARAGLVALALLTVACSSSSQGGAAPGAEVLQVKVKDFQIKAPQHFKAGKILLHVRNAGPETHELILLRGGGKLPLRADNLTLDEDALKPRTVGILDDDHPGTKRTWSLSLPPGRYELVCNMSGHYLGGMHTELFVK